MLSTKIKKYLSENADEVLLEWQKKYNKKLKDLGFNNDISSSFIEFMTRFSDEHYGKEGCLGDFMLDSMDFEISITANLWRYNNVSNKYYSLFCGESESFLLYNKEDDSVKLIEAHNINKLSEDDYYDKKWNNFNEFLENFFELD